MFRNISKIKIINKIFKFFDENSFDFRAFVCPDDELSYLFEAWVDYYNLKYALCKVIEPEKILEIGVRYGYSAITFLKARPDAFYLGIDNNSDTFGGTTGAINWAKKITKNYNAEFIIADTQNLTSLPGDFYDLIHIDGQQDGDGTFHDLELALEKGKYILLDGYFWSDENMISSTYFLKKYNKFIEFAFIIPGYGGELLIKTKEESRNIFTRHNKKDYSILPGEYNSEYYLKDCGGYEEFLKTGGKELKSPRLLLIYYLTEPKEKQKILDMGCGRGEVAFALSKTGADVTAIDYSKDAIEIAGKTYGKINNLKYIHGDILNYEFNMKFDKIIASDFIEHIEQAALEKIFKKASSLLNDNGVFIVHTSPNKLNYRYEYKKKRDLAKKTGSFLPENPRTFFEDLMHINEHTPARLNRTLKKFFKNTVTWGTTLPDLWGTLENISREKLIQSTSIFSVASNSDINKVNILALLKQNRLDTTELNISISSSSKDLKIEKSQKFHISLTIHNKSNQRLISLQPYPVHISYHWINRKGEYEIFDGIRTIINIPLLPGEKKDFKVNIEPPEKSGEYTLQISLVQEQCFWFENILKDFPVNISVKVI